MAGKAGQGEGSWRRTSRGAWEYRFSITDPVTGMPRQLSVSAATKDAARARARDKKAQAEAGVRQGDSGITLAAWVDVWVRDALPLSGRRAATQAQYGTLLRCHVTPARYAATRLRDLTPLALEHLIAGTPLAPSSRRSLHAALAACLTDAVRDRRLTTNPMDTVKRPRRGDTGTTGGSNRALPPEVLPGLLQAVTGHRWGIVPLLCLYAGLRRGEALALRWTDVNLHTRTITVDEQVTATRERSTPKTAAGRRTIPIPELLLHALLEHDARHPRHTTIAANRSGGEADPRAVSRWYAAAAEAAGAPDTGLHALRHTYATTCLQAGVPVTDVAAWLGHADPSITLRVYAAAVPANHAHHIAQVDAWHARASLTESLT